MGDITLVRQDRVQLSDEDKAAYLKEIAEAKAAQEEYEKQLASQLPTYEDRLSALESALLEMITGGETGG